MLQLTVSVECCKDGSENRAIQKCTSQVDDFSNGGHKVRRCLHYISQSHNVDHCWCVLKCECGFSLDIFPALASGANVLSCDLATCQAVSPAQKSSETLELRSTSYLLQFAPHGRKHHMSLQPEFRSEKIQCTTIIAFTLAAPAMYHHVSYQLCSPLVSSFMGCMHSSGSHQSSKSALCFHRK